jgi:hypothetical protein
MKTNPEKLLTIILDGVLYWNFRRRIGNLKGRVGSG